MPQLRTERRIAAGTSVDHVDTVDWRSSAACLDANPETFFPVGRDPELSEPAKAVCRRCPVVRTCLAEALTHDVTGVWGGTTEPERKELRETYGITAVSIMPRFPTDSPTDLVDHMTGGGGASAQEIADQLGMTSRTVVRYRRRINEGLSHDHHA